MLVLFSVAGTRAADLAPDQVHINVSDVTDSRTTGLSSTNECRLELILTGDAANDAMSVRNVVITKALDQLDRDLVPKINAARGGGTFESDRRSGPLRARATLRNPSRNAAAIKVVEGTVELFSPTEANGGILKLRDILKHPAEPVQNPTLKQYGIEIAYLTKESYEAKKKQFEQAQNNPADQMASGLASMFKGVFGQMMSSDNKNGTVFFVQDTEKRVVDVELLDANGNPLPSRGRSTFGPFRQMNFDTPPPADAQLLVYLATPDARKTYPFKLENIALP